MLMRMLLQGGLPILTDHARGPDEDNPNGYFEYDPVKDLGQAEDKSWLREARGKGVKVISHLLKDLPDENFYRVIILHRDLREVLASQSRLLKRRGKPNPLPEEKTLELYRQHVINVEVFLKRKRNFERLDVHYSSALANPLGCANEVNLFLGGRYNSEKMAEGIDVRLYRNRWASPLGPEKGSHHNLFRTC